MAKRDLSMARAEMLDFLAGQSEGLVAWNDGSPAPAVSIADVVLRAERLEIALRQPQTFVRDHKQRPHVACVVERSPSYYEIAHVTVRAAASAPRLTADGRVAFMIGLDDVTTSSFAKLLQADVVP